jgi:hypothetical protein
MNLNEASQPVYLTISIIKESIVDDHIEQVDQPDSEPSTVTVSLVSFASKVPESSIATATRPGVHSLSMSNIETRTLCQMDLQRILTSLNQARTNSDLVIAYHHNHYCNVT